MTWGSNATFSEQPCAFCGTACLDDMADGFSTHERICEKRPRVEYWPCLGVEFGGLFRPGSLWIGAHYSKRNRRWCINLLPMITLWICLQGGRRP